MYNSSTLAFLVPDEIHVVVNEPKPAKLLTGLKIIM
jgi:hypothetical protein